MSNCVSFKTSAVPSLKTVLQSNFPGVNSGCNEKSPNNIIFQVVVLSSFSPLKSLIQSLPDKLKEVYMQKCCCLSKHELIHTCRIRDGGGAGRCLSKHELINTCRIRDGDGGGAGRYPAPPPPR